MASLNHVCMWTENGWKKVTAEKASELYPDGTVSSHSGLFMCELCSQYVSLTKEGKQIRHFRHSLAEQDKVCEDRTYNLSNKLNYELNNYELPLKISIVNNKYFEIMIGFFSIPSVPFCQYKNKMVTIKSSEDLQGHKYLIERFNNNCINYINVGAPANEYIIDISYPFKSYWPDRVKGIENNINVFRKKNGNLLHNNSDVIVGESYYVLMKGKIENPEFGSEVDKNYIGMYKGWTLYEVKANKYNEKAAKYFLNLHCRLTVNPANMQVVWPLYVEKPYVISHNEDYMYLFISGDTEVNTNVFPLSDINKYECNRSDTGTKEVSRIKCGGRQQMISVGRTNVLKYLYFWKEEIPNNNCDPFVVFTDIENNEIKPDEYTHLMKESRLFITTEFDGMAVIKRNNYIIDKIKLKAKGKNECKIFYGCKIEVFIGLDSISQISFKRENKQYNDVENLIIKKLNNCNGKYISFPLIYGCLKEKIKEYPSLCLWLSVQLRNSRIREDAFKILKKFIVDIYTRGENNI